MLFDFGGSTTGFAAWVDGADVGFCAGAATGDAGASVTVTDALPSAGQQFDLVFACIPGSGVMRVWD